MENGESFAGGRVSCASESAIAVHFWLRINRNPQSGCTEDQQICLSLLKLEIKGREKNLEERRPAPQVDTETSAPNLRCIAMMGQTRMPPELKRARLLLLDRCISKWGLRCKREWIPQKKAAQAFWLRAQQ